MATNLIKLPNWPIKSSCHHVVLGPKDGTNGYSDIDGHTGGLQTDVKGDKTRHEGENIQ